MGTLSICCRTHHGVDELFRYPVSSMLFCSFWGFWFFSSLFFDQKSYSFCFRLSKRIDPGHRWTFSLSNDWVTSWRRKSRFPLPRSPFDQTEEFNSWRRWTFSLSSELGLISPKSANQLIWISLFSLNYSFLPFEFVPLVQPQYFYPLNAINWGVSPKMKFW